MEFKLTREEERILKRAQISPRRTSISRFTGSHSSHLGGNNIEFNEYSQYNPGDEIKSIDWRVAAKSERYYIKKYHDDKSITGYIILDNSSSMATSFPADKKKGGLNKSAAGRYVAFYLSRLYFFNREIMGYCTFDKKPANVIKASGTPGTYMRISSQIRSGRSTGRDTDYHRSFQDIASRIRPGSELYIISDFYNETADIFRALSAFQGLRCGVNLLNIIDSGEFNIDSSLRAPEYMFLDSEDNKKVYFNNFQMRRQYKELMIDHLKELRSGCLKNGYKYVQIFSGLPVFRQFMQVI